MMIFFFHLICPYYFIDFSYIASKQQKFLLFFLFSIEHTLKLQLCTGLRPGAASANNQRQDMNAVRTGVTSFVPRQDPVAGVRQASIREIEAVSNSRIDVGAEVRDPRQAAEMRRAAVGQGVIPRPTVRIRSLNLLLRPSAAQYTIKGYCSI